MSFLGPPARAATHRFAAETFGFESTESGRSRPDIVHAAKRAGYTTNAIFLGTETAAINISRVHKGGHPVDDSELRRWWTTAWRNLVAT